MPDFELHDRGNLGPRATVFLPTCYEAHPGQFFFFFFIGFMVAGATAAVTFRHMWSLARARIGLQRRYYVRIAVLPPVFVLTGSLSMCSPRAALLLMIVCVQFEAYTLSTFSSLMTILLQHEGAKFVEYKHPENLASRRPGWGEALLKALAGYEPRKHFAVPPFGCCFESWCTAHHLNAGHLIMISKLVRQFTVVAPLGMVIIMWAALAISDDDTFHRLNIILTVAIKISNITCFYGLMILYFSTHDLLHRWNTSSKFVALKVILVINMLQSKIVLVALKDVEVPVCFETRSELVNFYNSFCLVLESLPMAILISRAYPAAEVDDLSGTSPELLDLELEALQQYGENGEDTRICRVEDSESDEVSTERMQNEEDV